MKIDEVNTLLFECGHLWGSLQSDVDESVTQNIEQLRKARDDGNISTQLCQAWETYLQCIREVKATFNENFPGKSSDIQQKIQWVNITERVSEILKLLDEFSLEDAKIRIKVYHFLYVMHSFIGNETVAQQYFDSLKAQLEKLDSVSLNNIILIQIDEIRKEVLELRKQVKPRSIQSSHLPESEKEQLFNAYKEQIDKLKCVAILTDQLMLSPQKTEQIISILRRLYYYFRKVDCLEEALKYSEQAYKLSGSDNIDLNNYATALSKTNCIENFLMAIGLLESQFQKDKEEGQQLFYTPYYLAKIYLKTADHMLSTEHYYIQFYLDKAVIALTAAKNAAISGNYSNDYKEKAGLRCAVLDMAIKRLSLQMVAHNHATTSSEYQFAKENFEVAKNYYRQLKESSTMVAPRKDFVLTVLQLTIFSMLAELERDFISERTKEGLRARAAKGIKLGKPVDTVQASMYDKDKEKILYLYQLGCSR